MIHAMTTTRKEKKEEKAKKTSCHAVKVFEVWKEGRKSPRQVTAADGTLALSELEFIASSRSFVYAYRFHETMRSILLLAFLANAKLMGNAEEIWQQDLSKDMRIGASSEGYDHVGLRCGAERMTVELKTTEDFSGVIYTQGSFHSREPSCFLDPVRGRSFTMNIPLNRCDTEKDGDKYRNVVVIQHDDELLTPGDAAFTLECDFSKPRDLTVTADLNGSKKRRTRSSIALVDADPGSDRRKRSAYVESYGHEVVFVPEQAYQ